MLECVVLPLPALHKTFTDHMSKQTMKHHIHKTFNITTTFTQQVFVGKVQELHFCLATAHHADTWVGGLLASVGA
eukprot:6657785-Prorocentrum_lima.AAC.1